MAVKARADLGLTSLRLFEAAVRLGSLSAASAEANIAISAVSRRIADLEQQFGTRLLHRDVRGVEPTPAGQILVIHARNLLRLAERVSEDMAQFSDGARGLVRVAANPSAVNQFLPDLFSRFREAAPEIRFEVREGVSGDIVREVLEGHVDIGIFAASVPHEGVQAFPFRADLLCVVVPAGHRLAGAGALTLRDLLEEPHIGLEDGSSLFAQVCQRAEEAGRPLTVAFRVRSFEAVRRMAAAGLGVGILPQAVAAPYAAVDGIAVIPLSEDWSRRPFLLGVRERSALSASAEAFLAYLIGATP
ncbi:DNA-binding transcriptional regulator, LysR family [Thalassobaculum litoreum DSM 18839]|uniref:DNA-binding transcriptional regulator, LysR family n=1 Tax=Thalassobaculum litoreum DSM 18839 TaxID=1123362 RepID=A0A8G2BG72_9PROT|nr:DNA-binding transcriptional regulator, LysR family [Thalassobaculum litoreum DSM 18839]